MSTRSVLTGDLSSISLADLFSLLNLSKKTGALRCTQGAETRTILWEQGEIVFARSNSVRDSLGCFLVRRGLITEEQNAESARRITPDTRHGKVLVRLGYITTEQLWWAVKNQVLEIVYGLFHWTTGFFEFLEGKVDRSREEPTVQVERVIPLEDAPRALARLGELHGCRDRRRHVEPRLHTDVRCRRATDQGIADGGRADVHGDADVRRGRAAGGSDVSRRESSGSDVHGARAVAGSEVRDGRGGHARVRCHRPVD